MKPRLDVHQSDYTPEDMVIWLHVCPAIRHLLTWATYSDRRDAALMLRLTQTGALSPPNDRAVCHSLLSFGFEPSEWP